MNTLEAAGGRGAGGARAVGCGSGGQGRSFEMLPGVFRRKARGLRVWRGARVDATVAVWVWVWVAGCGSVPVCRREGKRGEPRPVRRSPWLGKMLVLSVFFYGEERLAFHQINLLLSMEFRDDILCR